MLEMKSPNGDEKSETLILDKGFLCGGQCFIYISSK